MDLTAPLRPASPPARSPPLATCCRGFPPSPSGIPWPDNARSSGATRLLTSSAVDRARDKVNRRFHLELAGSKCPPVDCGSFLRKPGRHSDRSERAFSPRPAAGLSRLPVPVSDTRMRILRLEAKASSSPRDPSISNRADDGDP